MSLKTTSDTKVSSGDNRRKVVPALAIEKEEKPQTEPYADSSCTASDLHKIKYPDESMETCGNVLTEVPIHKLHPVKSMGKAVVLNSSRYSHSGMPTTGEGSAIISLMTTSFPVTA